MKTFSATLAALVCASVAAAATPAPFPFAKTLTPPAAPCGEVASVRLDADLFAALDRNCANVRLFDEANGETPFLVRPKAPTQGVVHYEPLGSSPVESLHALAGNRIELILARPPGARVPAGLRCESELRNFEKLVTVSGSADRKHWTALATDAPIYDYSRFVDVRRDTVEFAPSDYPWYRVEIANITEQKDSPLVEIIRQTHGHGAGREAEATSFLREPFRIDRLTFLERQESIQRGAIETVEFPIAGWTVSQDAKAQRTIVSFPARQLPLVSVTLLTSDANFSRTATLEGCESPDQTEWQRLAADTLTRIRVGRVQQDSRIIPLAGEERFSFYRLSIENQDNPPLVVTGLVGRAHAYEIVFFPKPGRQYRLCYGGAERERPHYDTGTVLAGVPAGGADGWSAGPQIPNPGFTGAQPRCACSTRTLLMVAVALMAMVLAVVIARLARKVDPAQ